MKLIKRHIIIIINSMWRFLSMFSIFFSGSKRIVKQRLAIFIICFSVAISFSQQYTNYTTKDGLPSNHVYTILQDAKGFMWFLTDKGMVRYNGKTFKTFTTKNGLPANDVWEANTTPDGKIWYMGKSPILGYIENDSVVSFQNIIKNDIINPTYTNQVGDSIYPTESFRTFTLKNNKWVPEKNSGNNDSINDWIKIRHRKVSYVSFDSYTKKLTLHNNNRDTLKTLQTNNIYGKLGARGQINDSLFFWSNKDNYSLLNLNTQKLKQFSLASIIGYDLKKFPRINLVNNTVQITEDGFVAKLDKNLEIANPFYFPKHIKSHFGFIDKSNNVWLATFNNGIYKFPFAKREVIYALPNQKIQTIDVVDKQLIVGVYEKGFYKYRPSEKTFTKFLDSDDYIYGTSEVTEINTKFYASFKRLRKEINGKITEVNLDDFSKITGFASNEIGRKIVYHNGYLYGNSSFGINKINISLFNLEKQYQQTGVNAIINFNNRLLIGTTNGLKEINNDRIEAVSFKNGSFSKSILSLTLLDDTCLLINTDGFGAYITDLESIKQLRHTEYLIIEDAFVDNSNLWLTTNNGVLNFVENNKEYMFYKNYTMSDGLPTNHINTLYVDDKNLIVGTNNGIAILPKKQKGESQFLDILVDKALYNGKDITKENMSFKYQSNSNLDFTISNIDFSENQSNFSYQYKLEPLQNKWQTTTSVTLSFNNLKPQDYTFNLRSQGKEKQLAFSISPLWRQTLWAKVIGALLAIALITLIVWRIIKRSQAKKNNLLIQQKKISEIQLKALRSQMNPHFVFNSLSAIQYYINNNQVEASEAYLVKFSKLIRQFFEFSKETEITIEDEVKLITNYLDIEKLRFKDKFEYAIFVDKNINKNISKLPTMLIQPIVENAINHGVFNKIENGTVNINFMSTAAKSVKVEIIDDGVGFVNTLKTNSKKIKSSNVLEDRLKFLNQSGQWLITYTEEELHPELSNRGNKSTFVITQL